MKMRRVTPAAVRTLQRAGKGCHHPDGCEEPIKYLVECLECFTKEQPLCETHAVQHAVKHGFDLTDLEESL